MNQSLAMEYWNGKRKIDEEQALQWMTRVAEEGIVLLKNKGNALPLCPGEKTAVFGRMQKEYRYTGSGSGGGVIPPFVTDIVTSLKKLGLPLDETVETYYDDFVREHPYDLNGGWLHLPSQPEADIPESMIAEAAERCDTAIYVLCRMSGEGHDNIGGRGGYMATEQELRILANIKKHFKKTILILNTSGLMDLKEFSDLDLSAMLMTWTGGMMGGWACARVLMGETSPSGHLPDTLAVSRESYPSYGFFGDAFANEYREDIYVGYRWFETFAPEKVLYPFGFGLSYTTFAFSEETCTRKGSEIFLSVRVTNTGKRSGKCVVQGYVSAPQGRLGKPKKELIDFRKTGELAPGASETVVLSVREQDMASFDDFRSLYVLEKGMYVFSLGENVRDTHEVGSLEKKEDTVVRTSVSMQSPEKPFLRIVNRQGVPVTEEVPVHPHLPEPVCPEIPRIPKDGKTLADVENGSISLESWVARLDDEDLLALTHGEGMSSPKATPGSAAAFGGMTPSLQKMGVPVVSCVDGPSGMRLTPTDRNYCYPSGVCQAATFSSDSLISDMYEICGAELASRGIDMLLGPGMNIHRDPLCGRIFEYFSEDPLLTGRSAARVVNGLDRVGIRAVIKHFCGNSQELNRKKVNSVLSERALREIYTRAFEICIRSSPVRGVMTSYNPVNGSWTASSYDLTVRLLRETFGYDGLVMTDWWAYVNDGEGGGDQYHLSGMVHARNNLFMVVPDTLNYKDDLKDCLKAGKPIRGDLQRSAMDVVSLALRTPAYQAMKQGYGLEDPKALCEGKEPVCVCEIRDGMGQVTLDRVFVGVVKIHYTARLHDLDQAMATMYLNESRAVELRMGTTAVDGQWDYRKLNAVSGTYRIRFETDNPSVLVDRVEFIPAEKKTGLSL